MICAAPDPYGRLVGKRLTIPAFRSLGLQGSGVNASSFIFGVDLEMNPLDLPVSNADNGWVDIRLVPDLATLRRVPWEPSAALVICDAYPMDSDELLAVAPRTILRTHWPGPGSGDCRSSSPPSSSSIWPRHHHGRPGNWVTRT